MIVLSGFQEGMCLPHALVSFSKLEKEKVTEEECEEYCKNIPKATGCMYTPSTRVCLAFLYPIYVKREKGSDFRCQIFEENNENARKKTRSLAHLDVDEGKDPSFLHFPPSSHQAPKSL